MRAIRIDRSKPLAAEAHCGHNRWHPDIAPVFEMSYPLLLLLPSLQLIIRKPMLNIPYQSPSVALPLKRVFLLLTRLLNTRQPMHHLPRLTRQHIILSRHRKDPLWQILPLRKRDTQQRIPQFVPAGQ